MKDSNTKLFAGIDWASKTHMICVVDQDGAITVRFEIPNTGKTFTGLVKRLTKLGVDGVAIERCDGPLVEAMLDAQLRVVVITPRQVKGLRSRYSGSGAKSDVGDAYLLADVLRTDGHRLKALSQDSDATQVLRSLSRTRKQLIESRVGLVNQLRAHLERVFPGAIGLFSRLDNDVAIAFLRRYPTQHAAARLTQPRFAAFLRRIAYCGRTPVEELFARVHDAPAAGLNPTEADGHAVCVLALLRTIETTRREERDLQAEIIERLDAHADAHILTSLPKPATACAPPPCSPRSVTTAPASPTRNRWRPSPVSHPSPAPAAKCTPSGSGGPPTKNSATPSSTSPTTPDTPAPGPPRSTTTPSTAANDTPTPSASSPEPGSASFGAAGKTTPPTTQPNTEGR